MDNLFVRSHEHILNYYEYAQIMQKTLNLENLLNFTNKKIIALYNKGSEESFLVYCFDLLREWFLNANKSSAIFHKELKNIIYILNLENYLNAYEKNFILEAQSKQFTLDRNLKSLIIDFSVEKDENTYFHYRDFILINYDKQEIENIDFYLTNHRIVITYANNLLSFYLNKIQSLTFYDEGFSFKYFSYTYIFKCDRPQIIYMSFKRIGSLKNGIKLCE